MSSSAAADDETERPDTWDMSLEELQAAGLGQYRGDPILPPEDAPRLRAQDEPPLAAKQGTIFVNFDGANLVGGYDDSRANQTQIQQLVGQFPAYGNGAKRDAVMQAVRTDWAAYNVVITDQRPASGDYTMNMTGPGNVFGGGVLGIAPLDCNDSQTHNNITYAFHSVNDQFSAAITATTIGQEVAHSYGLEHVDEPGDIMNPYNAGGDASFIDQCIAIVSQQGIACGSQHAVECGGGGTSQNAHRELLTLFGPKDPDSQVPSVQIVSPMDGATFDAGADFDISVQASDDTQIEQVQLFSNGQAVQTDASEPYGWSVNNVPEGQYEFYVVATDLAGNEGTSNTITVTVNPQGSGSGGNGGDDGGGDGGTGGGTSGGDGGTAGGDGGTGTRPGGELPPGFGEDDSRDSGCGCTTQGAGSFGGAGLLSLMLLGFVRRRG